MIFSVMWRGSSVIAQILSTQGLLQDQQADGLLFNGRAETIEIGANIAP